MNYDWRYENSILQTKEYQELTPLRDKYSSWRTNTVLSNHVDTIMFANEMNINHHLNDLMQYDYLFHSVRAKKRFFKKKKSTKDESFDLVRQYYKYNAVRTKEALSILTEEQINEIRKKLEKGGIKNVANRESG